MAITETTGNPLSNILASEQYEIRTKAFESDVVGYEHGEMLQLVDGVFTKVTDFTNEEVAGICYGAVDATKVQGSVLLRGAVFAEDLKGWSTLTTAQKNKIIGDTRICNIYVENK